jgi:predicted GIY-YIG superfamily endonuclease
MKKSIILSASLLFATLVSVAQQKQTSDKSMPVTEKEKEAVKAEPQVKQTTRQRKSPCNQTRSAFAC